MTVKQTLVAISHNVQVLRHLTTQHEPNDPTLPVGVYPDDMVKLANQAIDFEELIGHILESMYRNEDEMNMPEWVKSQMEAAK